MVSEVERASRFLRHVVDEEILSLLSVALQVELVYREHRQVAVPADVHQASLVVEVTLELAFLETCFSLLQEEEARPEAVLNLEWMAFLHRSVAYPNLAVPGPEVAVAGYSGHCTLACHCCLQLVRWE